MTRTEIVLAIVAAAALALAIAGVAFGVLGRARPGRAPLGPRRILFPMAGRSLSGSALDAALRIARADDAGLIAAYLAPVPLHLPLDAALMRECEVALPLLEAVEQRSAAAGVPVETRIERGRSYRHAFLELVAHETFDRIVVAASPEGAPGFTAADIAWLLRRAPGDVVVVRPGSEARCEPGLPVAA
jgi:nucleotide-binding universal stress UspA family protein